MKWRGSRSHFVSLQSEQDKPIYFLSLGYLLYNATSFVKKKKKTTHTQKKNPTSFIWKCRDCFLPFCLFGQQVQQSVCRQTLKNPQHILLLVYIFPVHFFYYMSRVMRKLGFCLCKNNYADQLAVTAPLFSPH